MEKQNLTDNKSAEFWISRDIEYTIWTVEPRYDKKMKWYLNPDVKSHGPFPGTRCPEVQDFIKMANLSLRPGQCKKIESVTIKF